MDYERVVVENLPLVDAIVRSIASRYMLSTDEAEELGAAVRFKLVDKDYEVLRRFRSQSSLRTYLTCIVNRLFLDRRISDWGKWRPCAVARREGPHAVLLDQLITRDGVTPDEAILRVMSRWGVSREELTKVARELPQRSKRYVVQQDVAALRETADAGHVPSQIDHSERHGVVDAALTAALEILEPEDRLLLKLRFCDGCTVARLSQMLGADQKGLYRRLESLFRILRRELENRGVNAGEVADLVGHPATDFAPTLRGAGEGRPGVRLLTKAD